MASPSSPKQSSWQKAKERGKKFHDKMGVVANQTSNKLGAESFWPAPLDKESDKAAKILRSFCLDGFQPDKDHKSLSHIPAEVCSLPCVMLKASGLGAVARSLIAMAGVFVD